jgi:hypothetical protein
MAEPKFLAHNFSPLQGLDSRFDPIECADEGCGGKEVSSELVVAGGDAGPIFDAAEVVFDLVPASIDALGTIGFFLVLRRLGMTGKVPSSLISWRTFALS